MPYCLVGDEAFPLRSYLMRPFPGRGLSEDRRIFNYRLSRARRTIENASGILSARWWLFLQPIHANPDHVVVYTKAALCLHNFLRTNESSVYCPPGFGDFQDSDGSFVPGMWRQSAGASGLLPIGQQGSNRHGRSAAETRDCFKAHFTSGEGQVPWQYAHVQSTGNDHELWRIKLLFCTHMHTRTHFIIFPFSLVSSLLFPNFYFILFLYIFAFICFSFLIFFLIICPFIVFHFFFKSIFIYYFNVEFYFLSLSSFASSSIGLFLTRVLSCSLWIRIVRLCCNVILCWCAL